MEGNSIIYPVAFYLSAVALDESMCRNPALRLCSLSDELLSCGSASLTEPVANSKVRHTAFDQGYLTQIGLHSQQLAIQP
jgi:hypothetical protein